MQKVSAIVCFGLAEPRVDDLIEATRDTPFQSARWVVFGSDMGRLGALAAHWQGQVEIIVVHIPGTNPTTLDAAFLILETEGVSASTCIWLQSADRQCPLPAFARAARLDSCVPGDPLSLLSRLAMIDVAARDWNGVQRQ